jgi:nucleotide-binding universal stress UspA family protein
MNPSPYQRILVPVDGSETSTRGLQQAIAMARLTGGRIRVLHVVDDLPVLAEGYGALAAEAMDMLRDAGKRTLAEAQGKVEEAGVPVDTALLEGVAGRVSEHVARQVEEWKADLVVLGTHGRRGVRRLFLGSDAEQVLRTSTVPVLLVRDEARRSGDGSTSGVLREGESR